MASILISGIHGFVGNNLVASLKKQHTIYGLDIVSPHKDGVVKTFGWNELEQIPSVDLVIHLAGKAHDNKNQTDAQIYFDINTGLTQIIFDWFLSTKASKFIFFSSVKAAADSMHGDTLTEAAIPNPQTPYGKSKLEAERYILEQWEQWEQWRREGGMERRKDRETEREKRPGDLKTGGLGDCMSEQSCEESVVKKYNDKKVFILRPCMIHGPGNKGNLNLLYKLQQKGIPWPMGDFENKRSFCSIDNISFVIQQLIEGNIEPGIYQIADDEAISTNELINLMAISLNKKTRIWHFPSQLIKAFARFGNILHLPLNSERLKKLTESYEVSNAKIKQALSINQMPFSAQEGMKKTLDSFKNI